MPDRNVPIALLTQSGESGRHVREALAQAGTPIVYEVAAAQFDREAMERSGARVIVVNLDTDVDAHLDEVYALLEDDRYNVIFNESQVSSQLSGWEQARWARHLAAKVLGTNDADPPRPADAEPVPHRAPAVPAPSVAHEPEVPASSPAEISAVEEVPAVATAAAEPTTESPLEGLDFGELDRLFDVADIPTPSAPPAEPAQALDLSEFDVPPQLPQVEQATAATENGLDFDLDFAFSEPVVEEVVASDDNDALGFGDLDDFAGGDDIEKTSEDGPSLETPTLDLDAEFARTAAASDEASKASNFSTLELVDLDLDEAPKSPESGDSASETIAVSAPPPPPPTLGSAFSWTLEEIDEGESAEAAEAPKPSPEKFGIEKISAADYLAPDAEATDSSPVIESGLSLELIPIEEAVAPVAPEGAVVRESWMDTVAAPAAVRRVWVLGASIGGPEAVREFLAEIPRDYPALFLLAQHMGAEFMDLVAQQLSKSTSLTVRTPGHGERVAHGDVVIVPTTHRLRVNNEGIVVLEALTESGPANSPCIDQLLHDVGDRFGANAGVIVFSGMAEDAIEGSRYVASKGGKVFVQDPKTCVVSSMVDGVLETGVVQFTGSPKELAERLAVERRSYAKS
jgi:chemosensory pili system protein ChpB (putative protein-glutamate methylesterase)